MYDMPHPVLVYFFSYNRRLSMNEQMKNAAILETNAVFRIVYSQDMWIYFF